MASQGSCADCANPGRALSHTLLLRRPYTHTHERGNMPLGDEAGERVSTVALRARTRDHAGAIRAEDSDDDVSATSGFPAFGACDHLRMRHTRDTPSLV